MPRKKKPLSRVEKEGWVSKGLKTANAIGGLAKFLNALKSPEGQALLDPLGEQIEPDKEAVVPDTPPQEVSGRGKIGL